MTKETAVRLAEKVLTKIALENGTSNLISKWIESLDYWHDMSEKELVSDLENRADFIVKHQLTDI